MKMTVIAAALWSHVTCVACIETGCRLCILGLQPRDKAAMLGVKTKEYFLEEFT